MSVTLTLGVGPKVESVVVPKDALRLGGRTPEVAVVDAESRQVRLVPVTLGVMDGAWVQVTGAVNAGDLVVTKGNERLGPGMPVAFQDPR